MRRRKVSQKSGDALLNRDIAIVFFFFFTLLSCFMWKGMSKCGNRLIVFSVDLMAAVCLKVTPYLL